MISECEPVKFLNEFLSIDDVDDDAVNGIQVDSTASPDRIAFAVDARRDVIERAVDFDLLVVHHGLFWGDLEKVTGRFYDLISACVKNDLGLYSAHLPLDIHPKIGNNVLLAEAVGAVPEETFMEYRGTEVCLMASFDEPTSVEDICDRLEGVTKEKAFVHLPDKKVQTAAIMTGKGGIALSSADELGAELFITGERSYMTYNLAVDLKMPVIFGGHHATETFGIKELMMVVENEFHIDCKFLEASSPI
ncbi:MAG: Nif3-like dinuclear metal center hexameric protein [Thermoplasmata archaeon]